MLRRYAQGVAEIAKAREQGAVPCGTVSVRYLSRGGIQLGDVVLPDRCDARNYDWSPLAGLEVALHIGDETSANQVLLLAYALRAARVRALGVIHRGRGLVAMLRRASGVE